MLLDGIKTFIICDVKFYLFLLSLEECGRYLETIKIYENKPADIIQERTDADYLSRVLALLDLICSIVL